VYGLLQGVQNVIERQYGVLFRSLTAKNREKARERRYLPVCLHLTQEGTGSKGLMVMSRKIRSANVSTFLKAGPSGSAFFLQ
tara:strand:- start:505 stop:750 length:246 start_codon:yes stop_codon:yes gene_type:complete